MAILTTFIGIDRYQDPDIRELAGARRDAVALWSLFADTLPNSSSLLLVNSDATADAVRKALDATLGAAEKDDIVIFSFSGHGTCDHRIVPYDARLTSLSASTISMDEIAQRFRASKAKAILGVLDCCFSGAAPAKVVENTPKPRDPTNPLESITGKGRVLLAASSINEPAYELPLKGHGILTQALLDILQSATGPTELISAMGDILSTVRAEAAKIGVTQTPVLYGFIEGGLVIPNLKAGQEFYRAFPELRGVRISKEINELQHFGIATAIIEQWSQQFADGLNDLQLQAVNDYRILDGESLFVVAPTSSGKTFIGEMTAAKAITEGRKAIFLLPYKALVNEKYDQFLWLYGQQLGMRIIRCTGDYADQTAPLLRGKYDLALLTYEMFLNLAVSNPSMLTQVGLVVLDEAQFITDPGRGITVELLLTFLLTAREKGISPQLVALSAVIGDVNSFDAWLNCQTLLTKERPVPLTEGVLDRSGIYKYLSASGTVETRQLVPAQAIRIRRDKPSSQDMIVPLVQMLLQNDEKIIVFRNQRGKAEGCAKYLAFDLGLPPAEKALAALPSYDLSSASTDLKLCLQGGTAFHNTDLNREERQVVERAFRDHDNAVKVLGATTTVAAGINTPASTVILAEQEFLGEDGRPFTIAEYKNMAGRAGRLGYKEQGKAIILADNAYEREMLFARYVLGALEPLRSSFDPRHLETWIVRLLAQVTKVPREEAVRLLSNTYGGYLENKRNPSWLGETQQRLEMLLDKMIDLQMVEVLGDDIQLTLLGRACGRSLLSFASAMSLIEMLRPIPAAELTAIKLMVLLQVLPEADGGYTPVMKRGRKEAVRQSQALERYGPELTRFLQRGATDEYEYYGRCKRAALLWDWITGIPVEQIENDYSATPFQGKIGHGDVRKFADLTRYYLRSAHQIASVMFLGQGPTEEEVETLLKQLEIGVPADALDLLDLPIPLQRGEYLLLCQSGIKDRKTLKTMDQESLKHLLGAARTEELIKSAETTD